MQRKIQGTIISDKMQKTRIVEVTHIKLHPRYLKHYTMTKRFKAHDEKNEYKTGDRVIVQETKPISKEKRWIIIGRL